MIRITLPLLAIALGASMLSPMVIAQSTQPTVVARSMLTPWGEKLDADRPLPEYPRPQLRRDSWINLNGKWDFATAPVGNSRPENWSGQIVVPFPVESALSGVQKPLGADQALWYRRTFRVDRGEGKTLLHFGAVDWSAEVFVNGQLLGKHEGAYDPFSFDVTDALKPDGQENELVVKVIDPTDNAAQPRGKQVAQPRGIWYTPVSGIWQTVWLEPVPMVSVESLRITPDLPGGAVTVRVNVRGGGGGGGGAAAGEVEVLDGDSVIARGVTDANGETRIAIANAKPWSPESPFLYGLRVTLDSGDVVQSYFGMRHIHTVTDAAGHKRLAINGKAIFMYGFLDQGWWPDGLYTAPSDEALKFDLEMTKKWGFNLVRKHIKVEPARWFYHADRLGILVWQDMPSGGVTERIKDYYIGGRSPDAPISDAESAVFRAELKRMMDITYNSPCVVVYVPFNEGWFQHRTNEILEWTMRYDPTRLVDGPSGWTDRGVGHLHDMHRYQGPGMFASTGDRVSVLGEYGGLGLPVEGHLWKQDANWGYGGAFKSEAELNAAYATITKRLPSLARRGLSAAVYTQTTDVEVEVNGFMTYDRRVIKIKPESVRELHEAVYRAASEPERYDELIASAMFQSKPWLAVQQDPGAGWETADFDDGAWQTHHATFGMGGPKNSRSTDWTGPDIWIRKHFDLVMPLAPDARVMVHARHQQGFRVWINGVLAAEVSGSVTDYAEYPISKEAQATLKPRRNVIAVHSHDKTPKDSRLLDVGLFVLSPVSQPN